MQNIKQHGASGPLRILFVNRMAATERGGGETFDLEMARQLTQRGHKVTFLSNRPLLGCRFQVSSCRLGSVAPTKNEERKTKNRERSNTKLDFVLLRSPMFPWFPWDRVKGGWRLRVAEFWVFEKLAARWAWQHRNEFDVIQVCELPTFAATLKKNAPRVAYHLTNEERRTNNKERRTISPPPPVILRLTAPNAHDPAGGIQAADAVIASGTSMVKIRASIRPDCFDVPNGVDLERFREVSGRESGEDRERKTKNEERRTLLYVARFQAFKNHALLLRMLAEVLKSERNVELWLAGSGPLRGDMERLAGELGIMGHVRFLGEVPFDALPAIYAQADIKVISSEYESFCFAAIEAMASGLPVVTTDCGWVPGLIGDALPPIEKQWVDDRPDPAERFDGAPPGERIRTAPGGLVVSRTEPHSFANAVIRLLQDPDSRQRMGNWNRCKAEKDHGWEKSAQQLEAIYKGLIENQEQPHAVG